MIDGDYSNLGGLKVALIYVSAPGSIKCQLNGTTLYTDQAAIPTNVAAPVPTNVAKGVNQRYSRYHTAEIGEYCNLLVMRYAISLADFLYLN